MTVDARPVRDRAARLRALYASVAVSSLGDGVFGAAVPLATAALTRDPAAVAIVSAAEMLPWLLVTPVAGALIDRWRRYRSVMVVADLGRACILVVLGVLILLDAASLPVLAAIAFFVMIGTIFFDTASQAVVADVVDREAKALNRANGVVSSTTRAGRDLIGPPVGSSVFSLFAWLPFLFDALSFAISALLVSRLPSGRVNDSSDTGHRPSIMRSMRDGARWLVRHRPLRTLCVVIAIANLTHSAALSTFVLYAQDILHVSPAGYGFLLSAGAVGGIAGGFLAARVIGWVGDLRSLAIGIVAQAAAWIVIASTGSPFVAGAALALSSIGTSLSTVVVVGARQRLTPPAMLGRVTATFRTLGVGALPAGATLGGLAASAWGLHAPLIAAGGALVLVLPLVLLARTD